MMYTDDEIVERVKAIIAEILMISRDEVKIDSVLGEELGATSLDFVDIHFRLETEFKISFYQGNILEKLSEVFGEEALSINGHLTEFGAGIIRQRMPEIEATKITANLPLAGIEALFTTATWVRATKELLDARPEACSNCGSDDLKAVRPSFLICEACSKEVMCPTQEELLVAWGEIIVESLGDAKRS